MPSLNYLRIAFDNYRKYIKFFDKSLDKILAMM